ncbi:glycerol kinase [Natronospira proteinivora]|uniref:Glycerol kinase n=1 Tax=Natronospira proteinivora TaxID=1807133 RepID=A0ABT1GAS8_9GAMM|nr:FGGY family carbohydrate kinase [Natronospira proteinivora]MCP1728435.1 glycerol kinase [Natronospira proteinivora]
MAEPEFYLLLDQGGHSSRAMVLDGQGVIRAEAKYSVETRESGDRVEQDGPAILDSLRQAIGTVMQSLAQDAHHLVAAGLGVQRGSVLCWRRSNGEALSPVLSWRDRRAPAESGLDPADIRQRSGLRFSPYGGAPKLRWCLDELPAVQQARLDNDLVMGPLGSYLIQGLLREQPALVDPTLAQRTLLYDRRTMDWSEPTLAQLGIERDHLPRVVPSHHPYGYLRDGPVDCPLTLLQGDQNAVPWVAGPPAGDTAYINLGTGAFILRPVDGEQYPGPFQFSLLDPGQAPHYALEASVHGAGAALQWFANTRGRAVAPEEIQVSLDGERTPSIFLNTVGGLGSPWWQPGPSPQFLDTAGQSVAVDGDDPAQLAAILESLCFLIKVNLDTMETLAGPIEKLIVAGGLSRSRPLCQRLGQLMDRPLYRLENPEATLVGLWSQLAGPEQPRTGERVESDRPDPHLQARFQHWHQALESVLSGRK